MFVKPPAVLIKDKDVIGVLDGEGLLPWQQVKSPESFRLVSRIHYFKSKLILCLQK